MGHPASPGIYTTGWGNFGGVRPDPPLIKSLPNKNREQPGTGLLPLADYWGGAAICHSG